MEVDLRILELVHVEDWIVVEPFRIIRPSKHLPHGRHLCSRDAERHDAAHRGGDRRVARQRRNRDVLIGISLCDSEGRCAGGREARDGAFVSGMKLRLHDERQFLRVVRHPLRGAHGRGRALPVIEERAVATDG